MQPNQGYIKTGSASRIVLALVMVLFLPIYSNAWYCYTYTGKIYGVAKCSEANYPAVIDSRCALGCDDSSGEAIFTYVRYSFQQMNSSSECKIWQYYCSQGEINDPCKIYPADPSCKTPEEQCEDSGKYWYNGVCNDTPEAQDTTIIACNENLAPDGTTYAQIYECSCKAVNGALQSCGGSTSVVPSRDCRLISEKAGSCAKNGYQVGANSGEHTNVGECYAVVGSRCYFEDPTTKNTFSCECDGSCFYGMAQLAMGRCQNPYIRSSSSNGDTLTFSSASVGSSSSGADDPQSSGSGAGSSGSGSGADSTGDLEYDYYNELGNIIANTQLINYNVEALNVKATKANEHLQSIDNKMTTNNDLLTQIANKDFSPQVNVNVSGDTAKSPAKMYELLHGVLDSGEVDTNELMGGVNVGQLQHEQDSLNALWQNQTDIFSKCDTTGGKDCSHIYGIDSGKTRQELQRSFNGLMDSLQNGAFSDSVKKWQSYLLPAELTGSGSNSCPAILQKEFNVTIGLNSFKIPSLGSTGLCGTTIGGITFWQFVRILLRLFVGFACLFAIYRCVVGIGEDK